MVTVSEGAIVIQTRNYIDNVWLFVFGVIVFHVLKALCKLIVHLCNVRIIFENSVEYSAIVFMAQKCKQTFLNGHIAIYILTIDAKSHYRVEVKIEKLRIAFLQVYQPSLTVTIH